MNVPVYFENEQLYSFDKDVELAIILREMFRKCGRAEVTLGVLQMGL